MDVQRRAAFPADRDFLYELHKEALGPYVEATWGWDEDVQRRWFDERFDPAANDIVLVDGHPAGCVRVHDEPDHVSLDYIAMGADRRRRGLGSELVREIQQRAAARGVPLRLTVLKANPAKVFYERLGFRVTDDDDVRWFLEHRG